MYMTDKDISIIEAHMMKRRVARELGCSWYFQIRRNEALAALVKLNSGEVVNSFLRTPGAEYVITKEGYLLRVELKGSKEEIISIVKEAVELGTSYSGYLGTAVYVYHCHNIQRLSTCNESEIEFQVTKEEKESSYEADR